MKTVSFICLLAASTVAFSSPASDDLDDELSDDLINESSESETMKRMSVYGKIRTFGHQLIEYSLNLTNFMCDGCTPIHFSSDDTFTIEALLKKIYGTDFDGLVQEAESKDYEHEDSILHRIAERQREILDSWNDIWISLENKPFPSEQFRKQRQAQYDLARLFSYTFDADRVSEVEIRHRKIFGPGLNRTRALENLVEAVRHFEHPDNLNLRFERIYGTSREFDDTDAQKLVEKVHEFIRSMYTYVYDLDPHGTDHMANYIKDHLKGMNFKTLLIFDYYLEKTFGSMPEIRRATVEERWQKIEIVNELKSMMNTTLSVWRQELSPKMHKDFEISDPYSRLFEKHADILADFLRLEELRQVLRRATPILGAAKKFILDPSNKN